ncbi:dihydropteroate synthase [Patescibacteria group bacterium]|nr:dihydropteroate synthase [Patescibacteria group bacterium]
MSSKELDRHTKILGVVNVTPDSFSDGGKFFDPDAAIAHGKRLIEEGADALDIGGESSRPGAEPVSVEEELRRVIPVIEGLSGVSVPISIDTYKPEVAQAALVAGATIVNDISGFTNLEMRKVTAEYNAGAIIMHMQGKPSDMQKNPNYSDVIGDIKSFFETQVRACRDVGIKNIILDPGIGFGKTLEHTLTILRRLREFTTLGLPLLVGTSRKSFIGALTGVTSPEERLEGTISSVVVAAQNGASWVRVHDVRETRLALGIVDAVRMDAVVISGMAFSVNIGTTPEERAVRQSIIMNAELFFDIKKSAVSKELKDTIDYADVFRVLKAHIEGQKFVLVETMIESSASLLLSTFPARKVRLRLKKPEAFDFGSKDAWPGLEIERP